MKDNHRMVFKVEYDYEDIMIERTDLDEIITAYNILCENNYIISAVAVIEEAISILKILENFGQLELEQREFLMELLNDYDAEMITTVLNEYTTDIIKFRKSAFEYSTLHGINLRARKI